MLYTSDDRFSALDQRATDYRYDLDADIRWGAFDELGSHLPPSVLETVGVDHAGIAAAGATELYDWCMGLLLCEHFIGLERLVVWWVKDNEPLPRCESLDWLRDEEIKHIKTFRRYQRELLAKRPELAERAKVLLHELDPVKKFTPPADDAPGEHYWTWIKILAFEEFTVYLYNVLRDAPEAIQPTWLDVHRCHAQEEIEHVRTDAAYVSALQLSAEDQKQRSQTFAFHLMGSYRKMFQVPVRMLLDFRPELAGQVSLGSPPKGFFDAIMTSPDFAETRRFAPYFSELSKKSA